MTKIKMKAKIAALSLGATICCGVGVVSTATTEVSAENTAKFYMTPGAAVNLNEDYGGIRWTTVIEKGYVPADGVTVKAFGTFVVPTATYEANKATMEISEMEDVSDITATVTASDVAAGEVTYNSAIMYDDILEDYKEEKGIVELSAEDETALLKKAYTMELTAVSYALGSNDVYYYATAVETSRSARQVANIALLVEDESKISADKEEQLEGYIETGASNPTKTVSTTESYFDLSEYGLSKAFVNEAAANDAQAINVSGTGLNTIDWTNDVDEVLLGAKKISGYSYANNVLTLTEGSATLEAEKQTYVSVVLKTGAIYSVPVLPADGVVRVAADLDKYFGYEEAKANYNWDSTYCYTCWSNTSCTCATPNRVWPWKNQYQMGYYVLANDLYLVTTPHEVSSLTDSIGLKTVIQDKLGAFAGTFDGRGHNIESWNDAALVINGGIFDYTNGATIKNICFNMHQNWNLKTNKGALLATYLYNTTLDNVYIKMSGASDARNDYVGMNMALQIAGCTFNNVVMEYNYNTKPTAVDSLGYGVMGPVYHYSYNFDETSSAYQGANTYNNTYFISKYMYAQTTVLGGDCYFADAANRTQITAGSQAWTDFVENKDTYYSTAPETLTLKNSVALEGMKRYDSWSAFKTQTVDGAVETVKNDYSTFNGYWDTSSGAPIWKTTLKNGNLYDQ